MTARPDHIIANAWHTLRHLAGDLRGALQRAGAYVSARVRRQLARDLRLAEAIARRALVLMAAELDMQDPTPPQSPRISVTTPDCPKRPTRRHFALFEPLPRLPTPSGPDLWLAADAAPSALSDTSPLFARLDALDRVLTEPTRHARRLARLQARRIDGRISPLRPGWPPGYAGRQADDWHALTLGDVDARARRVVYRAWQTAPG